MGAFIRSAIYYWLRYYWNFSIWFFMLYYKYYILLVIYSAFYIISKSNVEYKGKKIK